jgi:predicted N-acetyltransferase YhbS
MAEQFPIRAIREDEFDLFHAATEHAFHEPPPSAQRRADMLARFELDRSLAAFDGSTPVGSAGAWTFRMCVPGALPPVAGVTWIAVMPSYRRRGILSSLIRHQFADIRDRGEPLAVLWASEAQIYGRFGYGRASWQANFTFAHGEGALAPDVPTDPGLRLRIAEPRSAMTELAKTYDELLPVQPGLFTRNESWWNYVLADPEEERQGASPVRCVLAEDDAGPRGYALYSSRGRWDEQTFLPAAAVAHRPPAGPPPGQRRAVGPPHGPAGSAQPAALRLPGRRGHRSRRRDVPVEPGPMAADQRRPGRRAGRAGPGRRRRDSRPGGHAGRGGLRADLGGR